MVKYHINGKGEPGQCRATKACPFGDMTEDHYSSPEDARRGYEKNFEQFQVLKKENTADSSPKREPRTEKKTSREPLYKSSAAPGSRAYFDGLKRDPAVRTRVQERFDEIAEEARERHDKLSQTEEGRAQLADEERKRRSRLARDHEASYFHGAGSASYYIGKGGRVNRSKNPPATRDKTFATDWHAKAHRDVWREELVSSGMSRSEAGSALYDWTKGNLA